LFLLLVYEIIFLLVLHKLSSMVKEVVEVWVMCTHKLDLRLYLEADTELGRGSLVLNQGHLTDEGRLLDVIEKFLELSLLRCVVRLRRLLLDPLHLPPQ